MLNPFKLLPKTAIVLHRKLREGFGVNSLRENKTTEMHITGA